MLDQTLFENDPRAFATELSAQLETWGIPDRCDFTEDDGVTTITWDTMVYMNQYGIQIFRQTGISSADYANPILGKRYLSDIWELATTLEFTNRIEYPDFFGYFGAEEGSTIFSYFRDLHVDFGAVAFNFGEWDMNNSISLCGQLKRPFRYSMPEVLINAISEFHEFVNFIGKEYPLTDNSYYKREIWPLRLQKLPHNRPFACELPNENDADILRRIEDFMGENEDERQFPL